MAWIFVERLPFFGDLSKEIDVWTGSLEHLRVPLSATGGRHAAQSVSQLKNLTKI